MMIQKLLIDRLAPAEPFLNAMPESYTGLAELPAQIHFFAVKQRRKIDQADIQVFYQTPVFLNLFDGFFEMPGAGCTALLPLKQLGMIHNDAALQHHPALKLLAIGFGLGVIRLGRDCFTDSGLHLGQQLLRLTYSEESRHDLDARDLHRERPATRPVELRKDDALPGSQQHRRVTHLKAQRLAHQHAA